MTVKLLYLISKIIQLCRPKQVDSAIRADQNALLDSLRQMLPHLSMEVVNASEKTIVQQSYRHLLSRNALT